LNILLAHGSPGTAYRKAAAELASHVSKKLGESVAVHFLDDENPTKGGRVLPLFLGEGKHVTEDVRSMAERSDWQLLPSLNASADEVAGLLMAAAGKLDSKAKGNLLAPYRFTGMQSFVAALYKHSRRLRLPAIAAVHGSPNIVDVLELWQREGVDSIALQPALVFPGKSYTRTVDTATHYRAVGMEISVGKPLSAQPGFADFLARLFQEG